MTLLGGLLLVKFISHFEKHIDELLELVPCEIAVHEDAEGPAERDDASAEHPNEGVGAGARFSSLHRFTVSV